MSSSINLDIDVLRTFVAGMDLGSFARAADQVGRSQSAVSSQLRKLEERVGCPLLRKSGRGLVPTAAGESLISYARRILDLNDEAVAAVRGSLLTGSVRLGLPEDFAESWLPELLGRFVRSHPRAHVEVRAGRNASLQMDVARNTLDACLLWGASDGVAAEQIGILPMRWIGSADLVRHVLEVPVPRSRDGAARSRRHRLAARLFEHEPGQPVECRRGGPGRDGAQRGRAAAVAAMDRAAIGRPAGAAGRSRRLVAGEQSGQRRGALARRTSAGDRQPAAGRAGRTVAKACRGVRTGRDAVVRRRPVGDRRRNPVPNPARFLRAR